MIAAVVFCGATLDRRPMRSVFCAPVATTTITTTTVTTALVRPVVFV